MDTKVKQHLQRVLHVVDAHDTGGPRLLDDVARLWGRLRRFIAMGLIGGNPDLDALELACYALQLPLRHAKALPAGRLGRTSLRDRAELAAELMVDLLAGEADEQLLDRTSRLLHDMPQKSPRSAEARLLADALNLDDFGVVGLILQTIQLTRQGDGLAQVADGCEKREQYGYWEARLKDGFHFEPLRQIAARRVDDALQAAKLLLAEVAEDQA